MQQRLHYADIVHVYGDSNEEKAKVVSECIADIKNVICFVISRKKIL
jgi:hypothetical protein